MIKLIKAVSITAPSRTPSPELDHRQTHFHKEPSISQGLSPLQAVQTKLLCHSTQQAKLEGIPQYHHQVYILS